MFGFKDLLIFLCIINPPFIGNILRVAKVFGILNVKSATIFAGASIVIFNTWIQ
ncbi:hypothetical protein LDG_6497 [Legionella drancourtii LLAP12]|uniref:Uncharacterized protein n=1 Tax=Legionella drancourtii LLAP12 TaxID=658187 RepID=G9EMM8_9GAMM|nr:hypothetical protein LDG_6497 [Legionella drancourtii LLAP12]